MRFAFFLDATWPIPSIKSSCSMADAPRRSASIPASTHTARSIAPLKSSVQRAISSKFTPRPQLARPRLLSLLSTSFLEWICRIFTRASSLGFGSSTLRSNRPDRSSAGSRISGRFVAAITLIRLSLLNPSIAFSNSSSVRCTSWLPSPSPLRLIPMASSYSPPRSPPLPHR